MPGGIFLLDPAGDLTEMAETAFAAEIDLQQLLARHPDLLAGDQIDPGTPRRWLLVSREVGIPDQEQGGSRWALDHLFLDQDDVPTLVEVKRGSDPLRDSSKSSPGGWEAVRSVSEGREGLRGLGREAGDGSRLHRWNSVRRSQAHCFPQTRGRERVASAEQCVAAATGRRWPKPNGGAPPSLATPQPPTARRGAAAPD